MYSCLVFATDELLKMFLNWFALLVSIHPLLYSLFNYFIFVFSPNDFDLSDNLLGFLCVYSSVECTCVTFKYKQKGKYVASVVILTLQKVVDEIFIGFSYGTHQNSIFVLVFAACGRRQKCVLVVVWLHEKPIYLNVTVYIFRCVKPEGKLEKGWREKEMKESSLFAFCIRFSSSILLVYLLFNFSGKCVVWCNMFVSAILQTRKPPWTCCYAQIVEYMCIVWLFCCVYVLVRGQENQRNTNNASMEWYRNRNDSIWLNGIVRNRKRNGYLFSSLIKATFAS